MNDSRYTFIRTDKNGTKYYTSDVCPKCGGSGELPCYYYNQRGICFKCDGSGMFTHIIKEYTAEYLEKKARTAERKREREEKRKAEESAARLAKWREDHPKEAAEYDKRQAEYDKRQAERENSQWVGNEGDKIETTVTVMNIGSFETQSYASTYYTTIKYVYTFRDENGNTLTWFTTSPKDWEEWGQGSTHKIKATIKGHKEYNGEKQTVLTRVKGI